MKLSPKFRRYEDCPERGVTMVLVALAMVAIIAMAAMSIDLVTLYLAREEAQRAADAGALAAARIISVSGITGTASPSTDTAHWRAICGAAGGWATQAAQAVAAQNSVGAQPAVVTVKYSDGTNTLNDCSNLSDTFAVNPMVTVQVLPVHIPSFFSRIWGRTGNDISASATAEAFNPSQSNTHGIVPSGSVTPVQPRCVKPWIVPNLDPNNGSCSGTGCSAFVTPANGQIVNPGISPGGTGTGGVIGEQFNLYAECNSTSAPCTVPLPPNNYPVANTGGVPATPNLQYLPGAIAGFSQAVPGCSSGGSNYEMAVAGCDQNTVYQCGQQVPSGGSPNMVDLSENPSGLTGDTAMGLACSLTNNNSIPLTGQDQLRTTGLNPYPFVALAGDANPLGISGSPITASNSIVSLPIYDQNGNSGTINNTGTTNVTIVGFLQVFVNYVNTDAKASVHVTVLNVAGCGSNGTTNPPVFGSSPVPVRLITPH
jgi:Flp pilus assembly protein TadG